MSGSSDGAGWMAAFCVGAGTLVSWLHGGLDSPIFADRAYFTYLAQATLRGEPIYANSFMGYPPIGSMISAAAMELGQWIGLPTYLAPRYAALGVGVASAMLLCEVTRRATGSAWAGVLAGVVLASFQRLSETALITLEPKQLVVLFSLLASAAAQRERWAAAGAAGSLATGCWQPAVLVPLSLGLSALAGGRLRPDRGARPGAARATAERRRRRTGLGRYAVGGLVGALPVLVYLALTDQWWDFWQRSVVLPTHWRKGAEPLGWLHVANTQLRSDVLFFWGAGAGFLAYAIETLRRGRRGLAGWFGAEVGGLPALTLAWIAFDTVEFQNAPDMLPILPCVGFWTAWLARRGAALAPPPVTGLALPLLASAAAFYGLADGVRRPPGITLEEQVTAVRRIVGPAGSPGTVMSFSAEMVYVLSERRSPARFLRLSDDFVPHLPLVGLDGCGSVVEWLLSERPAVVVLRLWKRSSKCERNMPRTLRDAGYRRQSLRLGSRSWLVFVDSRRVPDAKEELEPTALPETGILRHRRHRG